MSNREEKEVTLFDKIIITLILVSLATVIGVVYWDIWNATVPISDKILFTAVLTLIIAVVAFKISTYETKK